MSAHESFEQLCALAVTGDLEPEEFRALGQHLYECADCRAAYRDFHALVEQGFPARDPGRTLPRSLPRPGMKRRFEKRAAKQSIQIAPISRRPITARPIAMAAMAIIVLMVGAAGLSWHLNRWAQGRQVEAASQIAALSSRVTDLERRLSQERQTLPEFGLPERQVSTEKKDLDTEPIRLQSEYDAVLAARLQLEAHVSSLSTELEKLHSESQTGQEEIQRLQRNLQQSEATLSRANRDLESLRTTRSADATTIALQRTSIDELSSTIREHADTIDRERQLLAAGRDIRDLMGARNLRIVDVQDAGTPGRVRSIPGRIFYTQGKSLIFYAYDLQNKGNLNKVDFQVWGKKEGRSQAPHSLGIFYVDDSIQNRWVLKFEDPDVLAQIDQVFVTVEPSGGSRRPTGKQLLTAAFLNDAPNHP